MRISIRKRKSRQELICTACPLGCALSVRVKGGQVREVTGYRCRKGVAYAEQEIRSPRRTVTTTVRLQGARFDLLPVRTSGSVPRDLAPEVVRSASRVVARAPVRLGEIVLADVSGTGANLVATRSAELAADGGEE
jgi:CxxC motif-containing protein